jgi:hypothetical protein
LNMGAALLPRAGISNLEFEGLLDIAEFVNTGSASIIGKCSSIDEVGVSGVSGESEKGFGKCCGKDRAVSGSGELRRAALRKISCRLASVTASSGRSAWLVEGGILYLKTPSRWAPSDEL